LEPASSQSGSALNPYDQAPYTISTYPETHPDRLALVAQLSGLQPAPVEKCRVLEIGCATGSNIIPMAEALPKSEFVGLDSSARQIATGQATVCELQLKNLRLMHQDLLQCDEQLGKFDYIIAHGVYSWVPTNVKEKLLEVCACCLAPQGVAYISFNAYPGWHFREMVREMMAFRTRGVSDPATRAKASREVIEFLSAAVGISNPYGAVLKRECELIRTVDDGYLLHDHLEENNHPCHFHEFCKCIESHGLKFLAEAEPRHTLGTELDPTIRQKLNAVSNVTEREQYLDFLRGNSFRRSIVCLASATPQQHPDNDHLHSLYMMSRLRPKCPTSSESSATFSDGRVHLTTSDPTTKTILTHLAEIHPSRAKLDDLAMKLQYAEAPPTTEEIATLARELYLREAVELFPRQIDFAPTASNTPTARKYARHQAQTGNCVTNFLHQTIAIPPETRALIPLLDGTRTAQQIAHATSTDDQTIESAIKDLAQSALLVQ
jgi:methyltransferase-like protein/SAM-dependent methyltransferase